MKKSLFVPKQQQIEGLEFVAQRIHLAVFIRALNNLVNNKFIKKRQKYQAIHYFKKFQSEQLHRINHDIKS